MEGRGSHRILTAAGSPMASGGTSI